jgi:pimeloyl-ACP methyl ester carboxylesterase
MVTAFCAPICEVPDWSSAPADRYLKADTADDLATVLDHLGVQTVRVVAHDWGGPVGAIMMLRHPEKVSGFFGLNTLGPWVKPDLATLRNLWRLLYQFPMSTPVVGPRVIGDPRGRYLRSLSRWAGAGFVPPEIDMYIRRMSEPGRAVAGSRWYRTSESTELIRWMRG